MAKSEKRPASEENGDVCVQLRAIAKVIVTVRSSADTSEEECPPWCIASGCSPVKGTLRLGQERGG